MKTLTVTNQVYSSVFNTERCAYALNVPVNVAEGINVGDALTIESYDGRKANVSAYLIVSCGERVFLHLEKV